MAASKRSVKSGMSAERLARIPAHFQRYVDEGKLAGLVTLVHRHGETAQLSAIGKMDVEAGTPMREDAIFLLNHLATVASVTLSPSVGTLISISAPVLALSSLDTGASSFLGAGAAAAPFPASNRASRASRPTVSPSLATISAIDPADGAGTSIETLSVSSSQSGASAATASPGWTSHLATVASVPSRLSQLVASCLAKEPSQRPSAAEVATQIEAILQPARSAGAAAEGPYRGLLPFGEAHAGTFFGRDSEIDAFIERLRRQTIIPVVGPSGVGKSSFINKVTRTDVEVQPFAFTTKVG